MVRSTRRRFVWGHARAWTVSGATTAATIVASARLCEFLGADSILGSSAVPPSSGSSPAVQAANVTFTLVLAIAEAGIVALIVTLILFLLLVVVGILLAGNLVDVLIDILIGMLTGIKTLSFSFTVRAYNGTSLVSESSSREEGSRAKRHGRMSYLVQADWCGVALVKELTHSDVHVEVHHRVWPPNLAFVPLGGQELWQRGQRLEAYG